MAKVYTKGQVTLPKAVRDQAGIAPGDRVVVEARGEEIVIRRPRGILELRLPPQRADAPPPEDLGRIGWEDHVARKYGRRPE